MEEREIHHPTTTSSSRRTSLSSFSSSSSSSSPYPLPSPSPGDGDPAVRPSRTSPRFSSSSSSAVYQRGGEKGERRFHPSVLMIRRSSEELALLQSRYTRLLSRVLVACQAVEGDLLTLCAESRKKLPQLKERSERALLHIQVYREKADSSLKSLTETLLSSQEKHRREEIYIAESAYAVLQSFPVKEVLLVASHAVKVPSLKISLLALSLLQRLLTSLQKPLLLLPPHPDENLLLPLPRTFPSPSASSLSQSRSTPSTSLHPHPKLRASPEGEEGTEGSSSDLHSQEEEKAERSSSPRGWKKRGDDDEEEEEEEDEKGEPHRRDRRRSQEEQNKEEEEEDSSHLSHSREEVSLGHHEKQIQMSEKEIEEEDEEESEDGGDEILSCLDPEIFFLSSSSSPLSSSIWLGRQEDIDMSISNVLLLLGILEDLLLLHHSPPGGGRTRRRTRRSRQQRYAPSDDHRSEGSPDSSSALSS